MAAVKQENGVAGFLELGQRVRRVTYQQGQLGELIACIEFFCHGLLLVTEHSSRINAPQPQFGKGQHIRYQVASAPLVNTLR